MRKQTQLIYGMVGGKENFLRFWPIEELDGDANKGALTRKKAEAIFKKAKILESQLN